MRLDADSVYISAAVLVRTGGSQVPELLLQDVLQTSDDRTQGQKVSIALSQQLALRAEAPLSKEQN